MKNKYPELAALESWTLPKIHPFSHEIKHYIENFNTELEKIQRKVKEEKLELVPYWPQLLFVQGLEERYPTWCSHRREELRGEKQLSLGDLRYAVRYYAVVMR